MLSCSHAAEKGLVNDSTESGESPTPIRVKVLEEALCPGCKQFVQEQLKPAFEALGSTVIDLQIVPFGNAQYVPSKADPSKMELECQHGPAECDANSYEQCVVLSIYPYATRYLPFLDCLYDQLVGEKTDLLGDSEVFESCAYDTGLDWDTIAACHDDPELSAALQQVASAMTPDYHEYVPWIEIEGEHIELEDDDSFIKAVCKAYTEKGGSNPYCDFETVQRSASNSNESVEIC